MGNRQTFTVSSFEEPRMEVARAAADDDVQNALEVDAD
jgi:hypothetical protein